MKCSRPVVGCLYLIALVFTGCSSKQPAQETQSVSSSAAQDKASGSDAQARPTSDEPLQDPNSVSYAKNPERFVQQKTVVPPFTLTNPKSPTDFFDVGVHEDNLHNYEKAIAAYEQGLKLKPDWALLCLREAKDYRRLGRKDEAVAQLKRATQIDPRYWDAYAELAMTYKDSGDTTHAIQAASRLLDFAPLQIPTHNQLGYWYEEVGEKSKARQQFEIYRNLAQKNKSEPQTDRYQAALHELKKLSQ